MKMPGGRSRGRPRQYDPEVALASALRVFRKRGYSGTSLDELSEATGVARPSLHSAFGTKLQIYRRAVERYAEQSADRRREALFAEPRLSRALANYFDEIIAAYMAEDGKPLGCPILSVISGEAAADPEIAGDLSSAVERTDRQFEQRLRQAIEAGEIARDADVAGLAKVLSSLQHTLAVRARGGAGMSLLQPIARSHIAVISKAWRPEHETVESTVAV